MAGATVIAPINDDTGAPNVDPLSPQDATELISLLDQLPVDELELCDRALHAVAAAHRDGLGQPDHGGIIHTGRSARCRCR